jgi:hypothetical protein
MLKLDVNPKHSHYSILKKIYSLYIFVIMATSNNFLIKPVPINRFKNQTGFKKPVQILNRFHKPVPN